MCNLSNLILQFEMFTYLIMPQLGKESINNLKTKLCYDY